MRPYPKQVRTYPKAGWMMPDEFELRLFVQTPEQVDSETDLFGPTDAELGAKGYERLFSRFKWYFGKCYTIAVYSNNPPKLRGQADA